MRVLSCVVFLDMEDCLNNEEYVKEVEDIIMDDQTSFTDKAKKNLCPDNLRALYELSLNMPCVRYVITSNFWRDNYTLEEIEHFVRNINGYFPPEKFIDFTPSIDGDKQKEIDRWMLDNTFTGAFAIIDNDMMTCDRHVEIHENGLCKDDIRTIMQTIRAQH